jgi:hypothetical protein
MEKSGEMGSAATPPLKTFRTRKDLYVRAQPVHGHKLPDDQRLAIKAGQTFQIRVISVDGDSVLFSDGVLDGVPMGPHIKYVWRSLIEEVEDAAPAAPEPVSEPEPKPAPAASKIVERRSRARFIEKKAKVKKASVKK